MSYARNKRKKNRFKANFRFEKAELFKDDKKNDIDRYIEINRQTGITLVHGAFNYECEECGKSWKMWLEFGVEGKDKVMPCPFIIRCKCGGNAAHINWQEDIYLPDAMPLGENMSYFKLDKRGLKRHDENACGIPILK